MSLSFDACDFFNVLSDGFQVVLNFVVLGWTFLGLEGNLSFFSDLGLLGLEDRAGSQRFVLFFGGLSS